MSNAATLFHGYYPIQVEPYFSTPGGDVMPDIVLISTDFKRWALVEVELETHSFKSHILPQLSKLKRAVSDEKIDRQLQQKIGHPVDLEQISVATFTNPEVVLVTHGSSAKYATKIEALGVKRIDLSIHSSNTEPNQHILIAQDFGTTLRALGVRALKSRNPLTSSCWTVESPELAKILDGAHEAVIVMDGNSARWPISSFDNYVILRQPTNMSEVSSRFELNVFIEPESGIVFLG